MASVNHSRGQPIADGSQPHWYRSMRLCHRSGITNPLTDGLTSHHGQWQRTPRLKLECGPATDFGHHTSGNSVVGVSVSTSSAIQSVFVPLTRTSRCGSTAVAIACSGCTDSGEHNEIHAASSWAGERCTSAGFRRLGHDIAGGIEQRMQLEHLQHSSSPRRATPTLGGFARRPARPGRSARGCPSRRPRRRRRPARARRARTID